MTLELDARQRAMLDEMGVKVWWPTSVPAVAEVEVEASALDDKPAVRTAGPGAVVARERMTPAPPRFPSVQPSSPLSVPPATSPSPAGTRAMPPAATSTAPMKAASATGAASSSSPQGNVVLIGAPQRLYDDANSGSGASVDPAQGGWLVVADMAPEPDGRHGAPFAGDAGRLLDNMLRALQLHRGEQPVYLMRTYRGSTTDAASAAAATSDAATGAPANAISTFAGHFAAQARALAPRVVLAMGPLAAQALFDSTEPLGKLRGRVATPPSLPDAALIATYPPAYLLRNPADKARAWADLCAAAKMMDERAGSRG